jgi:hypothetical protein
MAASIIQQYYPTVLFGRLQILAASIIQLLLKYGRQHYSTDYLAACKVWSPALFSCLQNLAISII